MKKENSAPDSPADTSEVFETVVNATDPNTLNYRYSRAERLDKYPPGSKNEKAVYYRRRSRIIIFFDILILVLLVAVIIPGIRNLQKRASIDNYSFALDAYKHPGRTLVSIKVNKNNKNSTGFNSFVVELELGEQSFVKRGVLPTDSSSQYMSFDLPELAAEVSLARIYLVGATENRSKEKLLRVKLKDLR